MNIIFFTHPDFLGHQSMPRFANMLAQGMKERGHSVNIWTPDPVLVKLTKVNVINKWFGYIDQYLIFPKWVKSKLNSVEKNTLFVFCDQALGPWVPLVKNRHHIIHCHDFLAQRSALGQIPQNPTGFTGKIYQKFIKWGYSQGENFISVSNKTKNDLSEFINKTPLISEVVYNGLNRDFYPKSIKSTREALSLHYNINLNNGYILHVGGNQWYKNRMGILEIYESWRSKFKSRLPLILVGEKPDENLKLKKETSFFNEDIIFLSDIEDNFVDKFYAGASVFLFPSLAEGFGWPIAEAMASGSLVITTNEAPMNEVASDAGFYLDMRPNKLDKVNEWARKSAEVIDKALSLTEVQRNNAIKIGLKNVQRFDQKEALDAIEKLYQKVLEQNK